MSTDWADFSPSRTGMRRQYQWAQARADFIYAYKLGRRCVQCGENRHYVLHFHHRDPAEKKFNIGWVNERDQKGVTMEELEAEIAKCDLLCANCHAELHYTLRRTSEEVSRG